MVVGRNDNYVGVGGDVFCDDVVCCCVIGVYCNYYCCVVEWCFGDGVV